MFGFRRATMFMVGVSLCSTLLAAPSDTAQILQAYQAYQQKQSDVLMNLASEMADTPLAAYPVYWKIQLELQNPLLLANGQAGQSVSAFLRQNPNSALANRLLMDWTRLQAKQGSWQAVQQNYARLVEPDTEVTCYAWQAQINGGRLTDYQAALALWEKAVRMPAACQPVMRHLVASKRVSSYQTIERAYLLWRTKQETAAKMLLGELGSEYNVQQINYDTLIKDPAALLVMQNQPKETLLLALLRVSVKDARQAVFWYQNLNGDQLFSEAERALFWNLTGFEGINRLWPEALEWFMKAPRQNHYRIKNNTLAAWKARAGVRASHWRFTLMAISEMSESMANLPDWIYWKAKALSMTNRQTEARTLWASIAAQPVYYGILSAEEIGHVVTLPAARRAADNDMRQMVVSPGMVRAMLLFDAGLRIEGMREWFYTVREMSDSQLLAAAEIAHQKGVYDRAISAADQTREYHNFSYRYPVPFRGQVNQAAKAYQLKEAWVYGLIRQESRFVAQARSSAGASGLMQLMPATAKWTAKRINMTDFSLSQVNDISVNLTLGSAYFDYVLSRFDRALPPAIAGYNAGPGRPNQWRASVTLPGPNYIETIPFDETRDYVKKVLANIYFYELITTGKATPMKEMATPM